MKSIITCVQSAGTIFCSYIRLTAIILAFALCAACDSALPTAESKPQKLPGMFDVDPFKRDDIIFEFSRDISERHDAEKAVRHSLDFSDWGLYGKALWLALQGEPWALRYLYVTANSIPHPPYWFMLKGYDGKVSEAFWKEIASRVWGEAWVYEQKILALYPTKILASWASVEDFQEGMDHGSPSAFRYAGLRMLKIPSDLSAAEELAQKKAGIKLLKKAAELGNAAAAGEAGYFYLSPESKQMRDVQKALTLLQRGIELGDGMAAFTMGAFMAEDPKNSQDKIRATVYFILNELWPSDAGMGVARRNFDDLTPNEQQEVKRQLNELYTSITGRRTAAENKPYTEAKARLRALVPEIKQRINADMPWMKLVLVPASVRDAEYKKRNPSKK